MADCTRATAAAAREFEALKTAADESRRPARSVALPGRRTRGRGRPRAAAIEELFIERQRVANRGRLAEAARAALSGVYESDGGDAHDLLAKAQARCARGDADPTLAQAAQLLAEAAIQVREAADTLRRYLEALDVDPARQEEIERRAAALEALARKHRRRARSSCRRRRTRLEAELQVLENAGANLAELRARLRRAGPRIPRGGAQRLAQGAPRGGG